MFDMDVLDVAPGDTELASVQIDEHSDWSKGDPKGPPVTMEEREAYRLSAGVCWLNDCCGMTRWPCSVDMVLVPVSWKCQSHFISG
jgi:hypothetical protein